MSAGEFDRAIGAILERVHAATGRDFSGYKRPMLLRQISRRAQAVGAGSILSYADYLAQDSREPGLLARDVLIGFSSFFRDPEAFEALENQALPELLDALRTGEPLRIWVPACSTGEEAYSLAIIAHEAVEKSGKSCPLHLFATDVNEAALAIARRGVYPPAALEDVAEERRERFFHRRGEDVEVSDRLRSAMIFAPQDVLADPPFSRVGLISCRNLLIYLEPDRQQTLLEIFHAALRPRGVLFISETEALDSVAELFTPIALRWHIYRASPSSTPRRVELRPRSGSETGPRFEARAAVDATSARQILESRLLAEHTPAAVLVDDRGTILHLHGRTSRYLELPSGVPALNVLSMAREPLRGPLRSLLRVAIEQQQPTEASDLELSDEGKLRSVSIRLVPLGSNDLAVPLAMIVFEESSPDEAAERARERRSAYEAVLASREELQSVNEELSAINRQLNEQVFGLGISLRESRQNERRFRTLFEHAPLGIAILGTDEHIVEANPRLEWLLGVAPGDLTGDRLAEHEIDQRPSEHFQLKQLLSGERESYATQKTFRRRDGSPVFTETTRWRIPSGEGAPLQIIELIKDVSEQRRVEEQLRSKKALAQLGQMAAVVAHEVRNPLAGIGGSLKVIRDRLPQDAIERAIVSEMMERLEGLDRTVEDLLVFARPSQPETVSVSLLDLIRKTAALVTYRPDLAQVKMVLPAADVKLQADPDLLGRALLNLAVNAGQAMHGGGTIRFELSTKNGSCILEIHDSGPGLSPELREKIFEPFFTTKSKGTGLGLAIARRDIEAHGGTLTAGASPHGGALMCIILPLQRVQA